MPIQSIIAQPSANSLFAAYRPVIFLVRATATNGSVSPPVVFCDIYFGGIYYKTISKTMHTALTATYTEWRFDIQDAAQEYLKKFLGDNGGSSIVEAAPIMTKAFCKFRSSGYDSSGFISPEGPAPIQGTGSKDPVAGSGTASNDFFIVNSTLQHQDNQSLADHLGTYKSGVWNESCFPLTHRPPVNYKMNVADSDYYPAIVDSSFCIESLVLNYKFFGQQLWRQKVISIAGPCQAVITSITVSQIGGTRNVTMEWPASAGANSYLYRIDGGIYLPTSETSVTINDLAVGDHTADVLAVCQCSQGVPLSTVFTVADPAIFVCTSSAVGLSVTQTGEGTATVSWGIDGENGPARLRLDGGPWIEGLNTPYVLTGLSGGLHAVEVQPVCGNGVPGNSAVFNFFIQGMPSITKVNETTTGPGGLRTQVFQIGANIRDGNKFTLTIYSHPIVVVAGPGDTPTTIAATLRNYINGTSEAQWNSAGSAPASGTPGFPPTATSAGDKLTIQMNFQNSFSYLATLN